jgi:thiol-disulfide isomerase/thioredoxin
MIPGFIGQDLTANRLRQVEADVTKGTERRTEAEARRHRPLRGFHMLHARLALFSLAVALAAPIGIPTLSPVTIVQASEAKMFTPTAFEAAKKAGLPILVEVTAPWCSTCKAQKPILSDLSAKPKFAKLVIFQVDFDTQKDALKMLGVQTQSTLISYKGNKEVGRSSGVTNRITIEDQLNKSI